MNAQRIAVAALLSLTGCSERTTRAAQPAPRSSAVTATPLGAQQQTASPTSNADPCATRPSADQVRVLQKYPLVKIAELRAHPPVGGLFNMDMAAR